MKVEIDIKTKKKHFTPYSFPHLYFKHCNLPNTIYTNYPSSKNFKTENRNSKIEASFPP